MKFKVLFLLFAFAFVSCDDSKKAESDDVDDMNDMAVIDSLFQRNSEVVMNDIRNWENENPDYSYYADDYYAQETMFGAAKDSFGLEEMKENDKRTLSAMDFKMVTDPIVLLPGVNPDTKQADGSVRYYGDWLVTRPATDSTPMREGVIKVYSSYDFDENGKIQYTQMYGDFGGLMQHMMSTED